MNYKIIADEELFREFINWLPECLPNEQFYLCLFARKKYAPDSFLTNDKSQLKRITSRKEHIFDKVKQMECEFGCYKFKGQPIPQEALCLYITPNPRDLYNSGLQLLKAISQKICDDVHTFNPKSLAMDVIQTTSSRKLFFDVDIDFSGARGFRESDIIQLLMAIRECINIDCITGIETHGGVHLLVEKSKIEEKYQKSWWKNISQIKSNLFSVTMNSDNLLPVPGSSQGMFCPKFL